MPGVAPICVSVALPVRSQWAGREGVDFRLTTSDNFSLRWRLLYAVASGLCLMGVHQCRASIRSFVQGMVATLSVRAQMFGGRTYISGVSSAGTTTCSIERGEFHIFGLSGTGRFRAYFYAPAPSLDAMIAFQSRCVCRSPVVVSFLLQALETVS